MKLCTTFINQLIKDIKHEFIVYQKHQFVNTHD